MTEVRAAAGLLVSALIRTIEAEGGNGMVLAKGDSTAGAILLLIVDRGVPQLVLERMPSVKGYIWAETGPVDAAGRDAYLAARRRGDPDLWVVELDHPRARELGTELLN